MKIPDLMSTHARRNHAAVQPLQINIADNRGKDFIAKTILIQLQMTAVMARLQRDMKNIDRRICSHGSMGRNNHDVCVTGKGANRLAEPAGPSGRTSWTRIFRPEKPTLRWIPSDGFSQRWCHCDPTTLRIFIVLIQLILEEKMSTLRSR